MRSRKTHAHTSLRQNEDEKEGKAHVVSILFPILLSLLLLRLLVSSNITFSFITEHQHLFVWVSHLHCSFSPLHCASLSHHSCAQVFVEERSISLLERTNVCLLTMEIGRLAHVMNFSCSSLTLWWQHRPSNPIGIDRTRTDHFRWCFPLLNKNYHRSIETAQKRISEGSRTTSEKLNTIILLIDL